MNYAWCSTRCDCSVAELVHNTDLARRAVSRPDLCGGSRAVRGNQWPPPPRQRCRWRGRGSSLPSSATVGFVNCAAWPGSWRRRSGRGGRAAGGSGFSGECRGGRWVGGGRLPRADSQPYTTTPTVSAPGAEHGPSGYRRASQASGHHLTGSGATPLMLAIHPDSPPLRTMRRFPAAQQGAQPRRTVRTPWPPDARPRIPACRCAVGTTSVCGSWGARWLRRRDVRIERL